ncbi:MAG: hypothetical protein JWR18_2202 [Segetibacter sp.]|jgi:hypothetical protein|nr:hypothetical protein [Segetibacter sp.]
MITLDKILTELKPGSLNEIVAGCGGGRGKSGKSGNRHKSGRKGRSRNDSGKSGKGGYSCGCVTTPVVPPAV